MAVFQYQLIKEDVKKKRWETKPQSGAADIYESVQISHGETGLIATPVAIGMWNGTLWALLHQAAAHLEAQSCFGVF